MAAFVKSLQHKASRARLRQSQLTVDDTPTTPQRHPNHPYGAALSPDTPSTASSASASSPSLLFWRKPVASPVLQSPPLSTTTAPKPILRRASPGPNEFGASTSPTANTNVRFPEGQYNVHPRRASFVGPPLPPGAQRPYRGPPPPNAFRQTSMPLIPRRERGEEDSRAHSPANSVHSVASTTTLRHGASRAQSVSPAASTGRTDSPNGAPVAPSRGYDPLSPTGRTSALSFVSDDRRRSMYRQSPPSSPPSQDNVREQRGSRFIADSHRPAPPPPVPHIQAQHQPRQLQPPAPYQSQPLAAEVPQPRYMQLSQVQPGVQRPCRPSSVLLDGRRRRSSRPTQQSTSRTRDSITSLASLSALSISSGHSGTSPSASASSISSRSVTPVSPVSPVSPTSASSLQFPPATSPLTSPPNSYQSLSAVPASVPVAPLHAPQALPASQHAMRRILATVPASPDSVERLSPVPQSPDVVHRLTAASLAAHRSVTPVGSSPSTSPFASPSLASTPGGACPTSPGPLVTPKVERTPTDHRRLRSYAGDGSPLPMFKVIPATPSNRKVTKMLTGGDEDDDADGMGDRPPARILDFGEPSWRREGKERDLGPCVSLNDFALSSWTFDPVGLPGEMRSKAPAPSPAVTPPLEQDVQSLSSTPSATPPTMSAPLLTTTPPPIPAKSPRRKSLFMGHDDGRSISPSLAELATLACDLPREHESFGNELTVAAQQASARFAAARAATDTPKRPPLCAPPRLPPPPIPTNVLPFTSKIRSPTTPTETDIPRQVPYAIDTVGQAKPLPPSPPYSSHRSLPSLGSYDSVPSGDEMSEASEYEREQEALADLSSTYDSSLSLASTLSDHEEAFISTVRTLTPLPLSRGGSRASSRASRHSRLLDDSVATPKLRAKAFRLDFSNPGSRVGSPGPLSPGLSSPRTPTLPQYRECNPERELLSTFDGEFPLPPSPPSRVHRMSAAAANPNRAAFYGAASIVRSAMSSTASLHEQAMGAPIHAPHGSISSLASLTSTSSVEPCSDVDEDEVLTASIVAFQPYGPAKYVDPRTSEVGVAF